MACSKVTFLCVGLVAFVCLIGSGESKPAGTHHHKIPGTTHHHHTGGNGGPGGNGGSPNPHQHHHKGPVHTHHHGGPGGGSPPGIHGSVGVNGPQPPHGGSPGKGPKAPSGGSPGSGPNAPSGGGGPGGLLNGGVPGLGGGSGGLPGVGGVLNGGVPGLGGSGGGGLPGLGGGLGGLLGGGGGGDGAPGGYGSGPSLGPTGDAAQEQGHASRPTLAGPKYGIDDLQPTYCLDTPGYNDGAVKQFFRGTRDAGDAALDGANGLIGKVLGPETTGGLLNGVENAGQEILCHAESGFSDLSSDFGTATQYAKHGLVDIFEGIGHPSKNKGPPPVNAFLTGVAGILDQTGKAAISITSDAASGISEGVKSLGDQESH